MLQPIDPPSGDRAPDSTNRPSGETHEEIPKGEMGGRVPARESEHTLLKVLFAVAFISLLVWIVGWEYYFWPVPITVTYYLTRIALVKIRMRRNQER